MNDDAHHHASHLFMLRVWVEALGDERSEWRGEIKYVLNGETYYFRQWSQLRDTLRRCLSDFDMELGNWLPRSSIDQFERFEEKLPVSDLEIEEEEGRPEAPES